MPKTRFAPSPTGFLHLGHAFSALVGAQLATALGGQFLLRIEDIDSTRCRPEYLAAIPEDLRWLGLAIDGTPLLQSTRRTAHAQALAQLGALGVTYPCFCTRADIAAAANAPHGLAPAYPGTCRALAPERAQQRAAQEPHAIRLNVAQAIALTGPLHWADTDGGVHPVDAFVAGDIVLARKDIGVGYMLAAVVDDAFQGITHVVRGHDLLEATPTQRLLQALLDYPTLRYLHHRLLLAADGRRLAKRDQAQTLRSLRDAGADGPALTAHLRLFSSHGPDLWISGDLRVAPGSTDA